MAAVVISVFLILLGWIAGSAVEKRHLQSLAKREAQHAQFLVTDLRSCHGHDGDGAELMVTEVVIGSDYLKTFLAKIVNIFGGEITSFEALLTRARREARMRVIEEAHRRGYDAISNIRLETARIGAASMPMASVIVSGTAYRRAETS